VCEWIDPKTGEPFVLEQTHETIFGELLNEWLHAKDLKKVMAKRIVFQKEDGKIYETKVMSSEGLKVYLKQNRLQEMLKAKTILNLLPFDKALTIYRGNANV
jgi:hypothetical protein